MSDRARSGILVSSGTGPQSRMYARFRPCDSHQASGLLTIAAAAAPPPPPGETQRHWFDPAVHPPPPPSVKRAALEIFTRKEIRPRTAAICSGALEGAQHQEVCLELAETLAKWQPIAGIGVLAPFCQDVCWRSCEGEGHTRGADDGYKTCPTESCATESCIDFLKNACPPIQHSAIDALYARSCTIVPPSPPHPPAPPPLPPQPPQPTSPPPEIEFTQRERDTETDYDDECQLVEYAKCKQIVSQYARRYGTSDVLKVSVAPCQGLESEVDCFQARACVPALPLTQ